MKHRILTLIVIIGLLAASLPGDVKAALPTGMSWVKYAGNPVAPTGLCGAGITPSRPAVLVESVNNYKMYFTTHPGTDGLQIYLATTTDGGLTWTCGNSGVPVLTVGAAGAWDAVRVGLPTVINDGGTYKMWYTGRNASAVYGIGYATSPDGVVWTKNGSNPVFTTGAGGAWDSSIIREPSVVKVGTTYHLWYSGTHLWPYFKIGHATSSDGIAWTRDAANPVLTPTAGTWDANEVYAPSVVWDGTSFEMFYSGNTSGAWLTGHATSADGAVWTKDNNSIITPSGGTAWDKGDSTDYVAAILDGTTWKVFYSGAGTAGYQIGLATLQASPQLSLRPNSSSIAVGGTVVVNIDLTAVTNLYGYQFQVAFDSTKLSAAGAFVNTFFDTTTNAQIAWAADCITPGICRFAVTKLNPAGPIAGSGTLAQITFTGVSAGLVPITFSSNLLSDRNGIAITHSTTTGWVNVVTAGTATISGTVSLQGRTTPITSGTVTLYEQYGYVAPITVNFDGDSGAWTATVPATGQTYSILVAHSLYLGNQRTGITVAAGGTYDQGPTTLKGGDANNDGLVSMTDLSCIGLAFGGSAASCGTGSTDINADGFTNILDLALAGGNYELATPQPY